jgi:hypothetical protein
MAFISNKNKTPEQTVFCKAVAELFQHARDNSRHHDKNQSTTDRLYRTVPCSFGHKCKKINHQTGEDLCSYANSLDKLRGKSCHKDGSCDQHTKNMCKWYHEKQGQTIAEYAAFNGWFQSEKSETAVPTPVAQEDMQLETEESMRADQQIRQQGILAEMERMKKGFPAANYAAECNRRVVQLYEDQFQAEIEQEMEEVCDEIEQEAHAYEFEQEVCRIYQDPDEVELDEKIAAVEMYQLTGDMIQYMYKSYGLVF